EGLLLRGREVIRSGRAWESTADSGITREGAMSVSLIDNEVSATLKRAQWSGMVSALALAFAGPALAVAADAPQLAHPVRIQPQPLGAALQELARQSGIQIIFFSKLAEGLTAPALNGTLTPEAALEMLLKGTPLTFRQINDKTIEVQAATSFHQTAST